jgi:hypothetical protein
MKLDEGRPDTRTFTVFRYASLNAVCAENILNPLRLEHRSEILHVFIIFYSKYRKYMCVYSCISTF